MSPKSYRLWNPERISVVLATEPREVADAVWAAIARIVDRPYDPIEVRVLPARGPAVDPYKTRWIAALPHSYFMTYSVADMVPPMTHEGMVRPESFLKNVSPGWGDPTIS